MSCRAEEAAARKEAAEARLKLTTSSAEQMEPKDLDGSDIETDGKKVDAVRLPGQPDQAAP